VRAVLDANVFVSAAIGSTGPPAALINALRGGAFECITTGALLSEVAGVLNSPKLRSRQPSPEDMDDIISALVHSAHCVRDVPTTTRHVPGDRADDYLVALAREWHAALVTGDRHLLSLPGMPAIMTPRQFLDLLEG